MEYTKLGTSDLQVSRICLGCMGFGDPGRGMHSWTLDENESLKLIKLALDNGINFFDTASGYQDGTSEQFLGRAIKLYAQRDKVVIATKFFPRTREQVQGGIGAKQHLLSHLDRSLLNLGVDVIDLYIMHAWDPRTPVEETMELLNEAVQAGKIREIGISNCFAWQVAKANDTAERRGFQKFISVQGHYNLLFREEEREMVPFCNAENLSLTPYSPLASGRLVKDPAESSRRLTEDTYAKGKYDSTRVQDSVIIERVAEIASKKGLTRTQVALGWLLAKVSAPIVGATKQSHILEAVNAIGVRLTQTEHNYLEEAYYPHQLVGVMAPGNSDL